MVFHNVIQNTEEWFRLRDGKLTTSKLGIVMANYGKAFGKPAKDYALRIALEQITGEQVETESYSNMWTDRGHEFEPEARELYEYKTFNDVTNGGFFEHETIKNFGGSPDGHVPHDNGGIEIKCVKYNTHYETIKRNSFDPSYRWQMLGNLFIGGWDYIDFISYCPEFTKEKQLFIHKLTKAEHVEDINKIEPRVHEFMSLVNSIKSEIERYGR